MIHFLIVIGVAVWHAQKTGAEVLSEFSQTLAVIEKLQAYCQLMLAITKNIRAVEPCDAIFEKFMSRLVSDGVAAIAAFDIANQAKQLQSNFGLDDANHVYLAFRTAKNLANARHTLSQMEEFFSTHHGRRMQLAMNENMLTTAKHELRRQVTNETLSFAKEALRGKISSPAVKSALHAIINMHIEMRNKQIGWQAAQKRASCYMKGLRARMASRRVDAQVARAPRGCVIQCMFVRASQVLTTGQPIGQQLSAVQ